MSDSARADFRADVTLSTRQTSEFEPTRILVNEDQIVLRGEETKEGVALSDVFDIAQDVPASAPPDATATVTFGFERGETRETATIRCRAETLAKFQLVVFKLILDGTVVTVRQTGGNTAWGTERYRATLSVGTSGIRFDRDDDTLTIPRDDIEGFETSATAFGEESNQPTLVIHSTRDGDPVKTILRMVSFRHMNLFGRFLQSSPDAGSDTPTETEQSTADVLVVDDDPSDLETIDLMLGELDDRLKITTATSAPGGLEALRDAPFDCVVSDYDMPGTDGIEFLRQVRENHPDLPFILFTGQGSEEVAKQAILSDVTDYVEKGIGTDQYEILVTKIRKAIR